MKWKITGLYVGSFLILSLLLFCLYTLTIWYSLITGVPDNERNRFPEQSTLEFGKYIIAQNDKPHITAEGINELNKWNAWIQILDENGTEVVNWNTPSGIHHHYTPAELIFTYKFSTNGYTTFVSRKNIDKREWSYIIGFPESRVSKYTILFNPRNLWSKDLIILLLVCLASILVIGYLFGRQLSKPVWDLIGGITELAKGHYDRRHKSKGLYRSVYQSLNRLASTLQSHENERNRLDIMREEWIANLSHDLKTPLSSIKGYGEILSNENDSIGNKERAEYANVILKKTAYLETLLEDLKLTYQLKHHILPLTVKKVNLVDLMRTVIIELLNTPPYEGRNIHFEVQTEYIPLYVDSKWLRRAFDNLILNALIHNPPSTEIWISISESIDTIEITIKDNGRGISEEDIGRLFERYYRGTDTESNQAGTGLGMAIAKQVIAASQGEIFVDSSLNKGTRILVVFPKETVTPAKST